MLMEILLAVFLFINQHFVGFLALKRRVPAMIGMPLLRAHKRDVAMAIVGAASQNGESTSMA